MQPDELMERIAATLRSEIGPAVGDSFARTQAFMASVILEKLARQIRLAEAHTQAGDADRTALANDLEALMQNAFPPSGAEGSRDAIAGVRAGGDAELCAVVEALYADRDVLGTNLFDALLGRVRTTLRARLDRQLEFAS